jgi:hypothetical protein
MRREEVWHAARAACGVLGVRRVLVVGSQAVWGSLDVDTLPSDVTLSAEADIRAVDIVGEPADMAMRLGAIGQGSEFEETYGYYVDGVEPVTTTFPDGWETRLHEWVIGEDDHGPLAAFFPEIHDLCVSKLAAGRPKDHRFVGALVRAGHVDRTTLHDVVRRTTRWRPGEEQRVQLWLHHPQDR